MLKNKVGSHPDFIRLEEKILKFWKSHKIFEKSMTGRPPEKSYVFYDGPPFATGLPHYGHIVASTMKDVVPRYWTMKGWRVERRWGWDCHGLPIENLIEKELGLKNKKDIEKIGVARFNEACRASVLRYVREWKKFIPRMGRWVDMEGSYKTMDPEYMESIWWVFKTLYEQGLIYQGYKSMHICPRCETTLSNFEVTQGYKEVTDLAIIVKFRLVDEPQTSILAWTTTPWTLPGNVALAVGEKIKYVKVRVDNIEENGSIKTENYILAEEIYENKKTTILPTIPAQKKNGKSTPHPRKVIEKLTGRELVERLRGKKYEPLFDYFVGEDLENMANAYQVISDEGFGFVNTEEGTGVVHIAPAFGEDDMNIARAKKLPFIQHVRLDGTFTPEVKDFAGEPVKPKKDPRSTDQKIVAWLDKKKYLLKQSAYTHSYPHCWRCDTPLLNYAASSWFVKVTAIKDKMRKNNQQINWMPAHIKEGRFGKWLEGAKDWAISRSRYWGAPLPVWRCDCGTIKVIGSIKELEKHSGQKVKDLHKHFVDKIRLGCSRCRGPMRRVPEVLDCWFESGSMPYAQYHYPFKNKEKFEREFPAKFIAEGVDQTRGWFYTLIVLATALFNKPAFWNCIVNGIVLAEDGSKMSKRLKNYPEPEAIIEKYGADALRFYLLTSPVMKADDIRFSEKGVEEVFKKVIMLLGNVFSFYQMYSYQQSALCLRLSVKNILDRWILAKLHLLIKEMTEGMNSYDLVRSTKPILDFINELSTWYLRRSRARFKGGEAGDKKEALATLHYVLLTLSKLLAPFTPFIAEELYQNLKGQKDAESVHLCRWPQADEKAIDQNLLEKMASYRLDVEQGLAARARAGIKVRQVLASYTTFKKKREWLDDELIEIVKDELNIKNLYFGKVAKLDAKLTSELKEEGLVREIIRQINSLRKKEGLTIKDRVDIIYQTESGELEEVVKKYQDKIKKETLSLKIQKGALSKKFRELKINQELLKINLHNS